VTPFMTAVQTRLDGQPASLPETERSERTSVALATDAQVIVRSLAEQLVSEANAVLRAHGDVLTLVDETGPEELAFTLGYRDRTARVQTRVHGHSAVGQLIIAGVMDDEPRQLRSEHELQALVLSLIG